MYIYEYMREICIFWYIFYVFDLLGVILAIPAVKLQSQRGIIFPAVDNYDECFVDAQQTAKGTCRKLADCPTAWERWKNEKIRPQTCYFNKFDHIVCCEIGQAATKVLDVFNPSLDGKRRSEMACESYHVFRTEVVHGEPTKPQEFPYMAALGWRSNFNNLATVYSCGGVLISDKYVLTAAHCAELGGAPPIVVRVGGANLSDNSVSDINIQRIIKHPAYRANSYYNDIALIELQKAVSETPACVWSQNAIERNDVTALGYGHTGFAGSSSDQLLKAPLFVVANEACQQYYPANSQPGLQQGIASTHICAGDPEHLRDTCQGDSGGPIITKVERDTLTSYVMGITSFGQGCAGEPPSIYTRTSSYIDWIEDIIWPMQNKNQKSHNTK